MIELKCRKCGRSLEIKPRPGGEDEGKESFVCPKCGIWYPMDSKYPLPQKQHYAISQQGTESVEPSSNKTRPSDSSNSLGKTNTPEVKQTPQPRADIKKTEPQKAYKPNNKQSPHETPLPRRLKARERFEGYKVIFFETAAVPKQLLHSIRRSSPESEFVKAFSQWRLDFKPADKPFSLTEIQRQILSVMEKILTRGRTTLASPRLEKTFREKFLGISDIDKEIDIPFSVISQAVTGLPEVNLSGIWLDSDPNTGKSWETIFMDNILPGLMPSHYSHLVTPQIEFSSLVPDKKDEEKWRVDFGFFHPGLEKKIIVEIDGDHHITNKAQKVIDKQRDDILKTQGYTIIRIPAKEIAEGKGKKIAEFHSILARINDDGSRESRVDEELIKFALAIKFSHQIQVAILHAMHEGLIPVSSEEPCIIISDLNQATILNNEESLFILKEALDDFGELFANIAQIYTGQKHFPEFTASLATEKDDDIDYPQIGISFTGNLRSHRTLSIQPLYFPFHIASSLLPTTPALNLHIPSEEDLTYFLHYIFRFDQFQEGQYTGIARTLRGEKTLFLLPTGAGKSLIYQLASFLLPGFTVVIDPIISLMDNQLYNLSELGIARCIAINSMTATDRRTGILERFSQGDYLFTFIAPERFQIETFRKKLQSLIHNYKQPAALVVIDEAHCVSEWGHSFRTSYLNLKKTSRDYCKWSEPPEPPPSLGLTGTASVRVLKDVSRELDMTEEDMIKPKLFDREELHFRKFLRKASGKWAMLKEILTRRLPEFFGLSGDEASNFHKLKGDETYCGLIFCINVNGEYGVSEVFKYVNSLGLGIKVGMYTGKFPHDWRRRKEEYNKYKRQAAVDFQDNKLSLLVCTSAFGMGIDKPNIRYTIHFDIPQSIEAFYQEAGRAGRGKDKSDKQKRLKSYCGIIASNDKSARSRELFEQPLDLVRDTIKDVKREDGDDITRALFLHLLSFPGIEKAKANINAVLRDIGDLSQERKNVPMGIPPEISPKTSAFKLATTDEDDDNTGRVDTEKALHRLVILGIISEYTIDYNTNTFTIQVSGIGQGKIARKYKKYIEGYDKEKSNTEFNNICAHKGLSYNEFLSKAIDMLLAFIYENIEHGRRNALEEMVNACMDTKSEKEFRQRILNYFKSTYGRYLDQILESEFATLTILEKLMEKEIMPPNREINHFNAEDLRGEVIRYLESNPTSPEFLMLRAISESLSTDRNAHIVKTNFQSSIAEAEKRNRKQQEILALKVQSTLYISRSEQEFVDEFLVDTFASDNDRAFGITLVQKLDDQFVYIPARSLIFRLVGEINQVLVTK